MGIGDFTIIRHVSNNFGVLQTSMFFCDFLYLKIFRLVLCCTDNNFFPLFCHLKIVCFSYYVQVNEF